MNEHSLTIEDWNVPESLAREYEKECLTTPDDFRRGPLMRAVVENSPADSIDRILSPVRSATPWLLTGGWLDILQRNDRIGGPEIARTEDGMELSPTTARYARHISQLFWLFGPVLDYHVVEVGGGYGGLCRLFTGLFPSCSYKLYDIPIGLTLQSRYLAGARARVRYFSTIEPTDCDLFISVASLCELRRPVIDEFGASVLAKSRRGYVVWSRPAEGLDGPDQVIPWLKTLGIDATYGENDPLFHSVCTDHSGETSVYYWGNR